MKALKVIAVLALLAVAWSAAKRPQPAQRQQDAPASPDQPDLSASVVSLTCSPNHGRPRADITIRNIGTTAINYPKAFIDFGGAIGDGYLRPHPIPPGSLASGVIYSPDSRPQANCALIGLQDG